MMKGRFALGKLFCACMVLASLFSLVFAAGHVGHECSGEHCVFCAQATSARYVLQMLGMVAMCIVLVLAALASALYEHAPKRSAYVTTLVGQKIRLNN
jgi:hypothetical protein